LLGKKQLREATEIFKLTVDQFPSSSIGFAGLGEAQVASGNKEMALKNYQRAVELDPANRTAREALDKLQGRQ